MLVFHQEVGTRMIPFAGLYLKKSFYKMPNLFLNVYVPTDTSMLWWITYGIEEKWKVRTQIRLDLM